MKPLTSVITWFLDIWVLFFLLLLTVFLRTSEPHSQPEPWHSRIAQEQKRDGDTSKGYQRRFNFGPPWSRDTAFHILLNTELFASGSVGLGGNPSVQSLAFYVVLQQEDAEDAFLDLYERGYAAGKLYALCGLRLLDSAMFAEKARPLLASHDTASLYHGCLIGSGSPVSEVLYQSDGLQYIQPIDMGVSDLIVEVEGVNIRSEQGTVFDIVGGGWPLSLVRAGRVVEADPEDE